MQYTEGTIGRVFILRLEDGEVLNDTIEAFARDHEVDRALVTYLGGSADGSRVVVGPEATDSAAGSRETADPEPVVPIVHRLSGHREVLALGTLVPNQAGEPTLHM